MKKMKSASNTHDFNLNPLNKKFCHFQVNQLIVSRKDKDQTISVLI